VFVFFAADVVSPLRLCETSLISIFVQNIHYEMEDLLEQANEIQDSLSRSYAVPDEIDEADLEAGARSSQLPIPPSCSMILTELDALQFEEEEEGPSYLADLNKAPDFIDEAPIEQVEVRIRIHV
jgi:charged multivesicular body protein 5